MLLPAGKPIFNMALNPRQHAERIIKKCARRQGHPESTAKNLFSV